MRFQRTLKTAVAFEGVGLHSGKRVSLKVTPAPAGSGIVFARCDGAGGEVLADCGALGGESGPGMRASSRCTSLVRGQTKVRTVEHLLAALYGLSIDNAKIEIDSEELPVLDGSAAEFALRLEEASCAEQERERREFILKKSVILHERGRVIVALPSESLRLTYIMDIPSCGLTGCVDFRFADAEAKKKIFMEHIAPARTFCPEDEVAGILEAGLGKGGTYENNLVIRDGSPVENEFRMPDEPARHKILDLLGDLSVLGADIKASVTGIGSGHALNGKLVKRLGGMMPA